MNSVTKIGRLALTRLFTSKPFWKSGDNTITKVEFSKEILILQRRSADIEYVHDHDAQYYAGGSYKVWGIELGLHTLDVQPHQNPLDALTTLLTKVRAPLPSHVVVHTWSNSDHHSETAYKIYRLSQPQEELLRKIKTDARCAKTH
jgi:hypothetical protein